MLTEINYHLFTLVNATPNASKLTIWIATFCAEYLIYFPILIGALCWLKKPVTRDTIYRVIITVIVSLFITTILRITIQSPRPFELAQGTNYLMHINSASFPSKHATVLFSITFSLLYCHKKKIIFFIGALLSILVCWARIYLGVHWPLDILAAILISFICATATYYYWSNFKKIFDSIKIVFTSLHLKHRSS